jgi:hypothetical protein
MRVIRIPDSSQLKGADMQTNRVYLAFLLAFILIVLPIFSLAQEEPQLTAEQQREFLLSAKVIQSKQLSKGITNSYRLTLSDGVITHDAHFQSINERRSYKQFDSGGESNFVDSYLYNIAAYELAGLIGLDDMLPVTVERKWQGKMGAVAWWLPTQMSLGEKQKNKISPPDLEAWNNSMYKLRVFTQLIHDTDRSNPGNVLIGNKWEVYMIDFTRAFRLYYDLKNPQDLVRCSRELLEKLRALNRDVLAAKVGNHLTGLEMDGVMKRREKIVALFEKLIAEKGEAAVLY